MHIHRHTNTRTKGQLDQPTHLKRVYKQLQPVLEAAINNQQLQTKHQERIGVHTHTWYYFWVHTKSAANTMIDTYIEASSRIVLKPTWSHKPTLQCLPAWKQCLQGKSWLCSHSNHRLTVIPTQTFPYQNKLTQDPPDRFTSW